MCYVGDRDRKGLFRQSHICIVYVLIDPVEWCSEKLGGNNTVMYISLVHTR